MMTNINALLKKSEVFNYSRRWYIYRGADKSLARPWKETSYSDQNLHYTKSYGV